MKEESGQCQGEGGLHTKREGQECSKGEGWGSSHYVLAEGLVQPYMLVLATQTYNDALLTQY